jgi:hypothetical protein
MEPQIGVKLLLTYEVPHQKLQEYYQFVMGSYVPAMQAYGLQMSEAWHTAYGDAPNRLIGFICHDESIMKRVLESDDWKLLNDQLQNLVTDFSYKVIPYRGGFQI